MLPACELSIGTSPHCTRPTSTASKTVRIDGNGWCSASGKRACAPSSEYAPTSPWYATTATLGSSRRFRCGACLGGLRRLTLLDVAVCVAERGEGPEERSDADRQDPQAPMAGGEVVGGADGPARRKRAGRDCRPGEH